MEYQTKVTSQAEVFGAMETADFSILANGKAFSVLISGLYADKIQSIVREACANAYDGHVKAGTVDRPFKVHAPTRWEPYFHVRDFGCSMDHEFMMKLYTTLFYSSKDTSNDEAGCFGLGSKAPFAYTTTFTVTAWKDGERRVYTAYIDNDDRPRMVLNERAESDEERGIMVSFPVQERDFHAFHSAIANAALGYDLPFECEGVHLRSIEYGQRNGAYDIVRYGMTGDGPWVRIGPVIYPLDTTNETALFAFDQKNPMIRPMLKHSRDVIINMPISAGAVTPSRESLSYTPEMIESLAVHLDTICAKASARVAAVFAGCNTVWDYALAFRKAQQLDDLSAYEREMVSEYSTPFGFVADVLSMAVPNNIAPGGVFRYSLSESRRKDTKALGREEGTVVVVQTENVSSVAARIWHYMKQNNVETVYLFRSFDPMRVFKATERSLKDADRKTRKIKLGDLLARLRRTKTIIEKLPQDFGCPTVLDAAALERPPRQPPKVKAPVVYEYSHRSTWTPTHLDYFAENKKTLIVPLDNRYYSCKAGVFPQVDKLVEVLPLFGLDHKQVVGVAQSRVSLLRQFRPDWESIDDVFSAKVDTTLAIDLLNALHCKSWAADKKGHQHRRVALLRVLSYCAPEMAGNFKPYFDAIDAVAEKMAEAKQRIAVIYAKIGCRPENVYIINSVLRMLSVPPPSDEVADETTISAAFAGLTKLYPEIDRVLSFESNPVLIASYLTGRPLINAPPPDAAESDDDDAAEQEEEDLDEAA